MNLYKHCEICSKRNYDLKHGTTCSLTDRKPSFKFKCNKLDFNENQIELIKKTNIQYYRVTDNKTSVVSHFIFYGVGSILVMIAGYLIGSIILSKGVISSIPIIIMGSGFLSLPYATRPFIQYLQHLKVVKNNLEELNKILSLYNITYEFKIIIDTDVHGNVEYDGKVLM